MVTICRLAKNSYPSSTTWWALQIKSRSCLFKKRAHYVRAEDEANSSVVLLPAGEVFFWVRPKQIAEKSCVRDVGWSHDSSDLLHVAEFWGEPSVHAEYLFVNDRCNRQAVETVCERLP